ncbi:hypothetical protein CBM2615_B10125 [Cupriavidus taiwanensis]|uniref:Uncharacterized protein n=1 Tax=Cupriavidus taiwanensis TaxID=164546 RepID=A0A375E523_9BURK|nr:hypothetical protein CBM2615_B10125 [Cupriavidus taiwanensis]SOZ62079.1 hypothetical protein CBM2614_B10033 [Cupriavidus taiwanensis]SOZ66129.1 hypothetical protein CBM2613_B10125 [Cupriavidus taiwanensis]SPA07430.1 hypothetical protein CBM2625_B10125 [Cupriavidus taiwanensis]
MALNVARHSERPVRLFDRRPLRRRARIKRRGQKKKPTRGVLVGFPGLLEPNSSCYEYKRAYMRCKSRFYQGIPLARYTPLRISGIFAPEIIFRLLIAVAGKFPPAQCPPVIAGQGRVFARPSG